MPLILRVTDESKSLEIYPVERNAHSDIIPIIFSDSGDSRVGDCMEISIDDAKDIIEYLQNLIKQQI